MQKGPHNPVAEQERINDNLPLNIFYGGEEEMKILTKYIQNGPK